MFSAAKHLTIQYSTFLSLIRAYDSSITLRARSMAFHLAKVIFDNAFRNMFITAFRMCLIFQQ